MSSPAETVAVFTVKFVVTILSHPPEVLIVSLYVPGFPTTVPDGSV